MHPFAIGNTILARCVATQWFCCRRAEAAVRDGELESGHQWDELPKVAMKLYPYLRDNREAIRHVVLDSVNNLMNLRRGATTEAASSLIGLAADCLPLHSSQGLSHGAISDQEEQVYMRVANILWEGAYDAIKYLHNDEILEAACLEISRIARVARFNNLNLLVAKVDECFASMFELIVPEDPPAFHDIVNYFEGEARLETRPLPSVLLRGR